VVASVSGIIWPLSLLFRLGSSPMTCFLTMDPVPAVVVRFRTLARSSAKVRPMNIGRASSTFFGTLVDWRTGVGGRLAAFFKAKTSPASSDGICDRVAQALPAAMDEVRCGRRAWTILDELHLRACSSSSAAMASKTFSARGRGRLESRLAPARSLADVVEGLTRLNRS